MYTPRRDALRTYFIEVVKDLVSRGLIKYKTGQSTQDIIRSEPSIVVREITSDLTSVAGELGLDLLQGGARMAGALNHPLAGVAAAGLQAIVESFKSKK